MTTQTDPRIGELQAQAREEGIVLPLPVDLILFLEDRGYVVDLATATVYNAIVATPTANAKAVCHLLGAVEGEFVTT